MLLKVVLESDNENYIKFILNKIIWETTSKM
jgi:hypothetical protein